MAQLSYRQTKDIYDTLKDAGATTLSLPEWSRQMAQTTESDTFDAGLKDNWLKRLNTSIDRGIEWTGLPGVTGEIGAGIGGIFGMEDAGRRAGEGVPRMAADIASFFIPGLGGPTAAARLLPAMGMSGMGSYAETGSPAAGVASAALMGVLPGATEMTEQWALRQLGAKKMAGDVLSKAGTTLMDSGTTEGFSRYLPQNLAQGAGAYAAGQGAAMGLMGGSSMAQQALSGEEISNPFTGEFWLSQGIQNLPFMALHGAKKLTGPSYGKAIEATGQALLEGHDALAWKQLQRDVVDYGKTKDKPKGEAQPLTPKAQSMWDRAQGKPPTEEDYSAANGWLTEVENARRLAESEPTDEEAQKNLQRIQSDLEDVVTSGEVPFTAFVQRGVPTKEVEGKISHVTQGGKVYADILTDSGSYERIGFPSTLMPDKYVAGQEGKFKIPADPQYVERNVRQNPAYLAHVEALRAKEEARVAREAAQTQLPLTSEHDAARLRAEELDRVAHGASQKEIELERQQRTKALQDAGDLVAKFSVAPITDKIAIAKQIEKLLTGAGFPSIYDSKAVRYGSLAGVTAHNLGLALDEKGVPWLKSELRKFQVSLAREKETDSLTKSTISLDAAKEKGDAIEAKALNTQAEFDADVTPEEHRAMDEVFETSQTDDGIVEGLQHDLAAKVIQESDKAKELFAKWKKTQKDDISFREEMGRVFAYLRAKVGQGEKFNLKDFFASDDIPGALTVDAGDLENFASRPHVVELEKEFAKQLQRPSTPLAAKARAERYSAGSDFIWSVNPEVAMPKLAKDGKVDEAWFVKNAGIGQDKGVPPLEVEILKAVDKAQGLGIFEGGKVDMEKLKAAMADPKVWPKVTEVKEFEPERKGDTSAAQAARARANELQHELETRGYRVTLDLAVDGMDSTVEKNGEIVAEGVDSLVDEFYASAQAGSQLHIEGDPTTGRRGGAGTAQWMSMSSAEHGVGNPKGYGEFAVVAKGYKFTGQHAPFPDGTIYHFRFYFADHPVEGRVLVWEEGQGDAAQQLRSVLEFNKKTQERANKGEITQEQADKIKQAHIDAGPPNHPLLPVAHVLGLKAALAKIAKESLGTKLMVISDVGAMMVEGHDKQNVVTVEDTQTNRILLQGAGESFHADGNKRLRLESIEGLPEGLTGLTNEPSQSGGMTTAYANTYYVLRDAEGKTVKGRVFRTEGEAQEAADALNKQQPKSEAIPNISEHRLNLVENTPAQKSKLESELFGSLSKDEQKEVFAAQAKAADNIRKAREFGYAAKRDVDRQQLSNSDGWSELWNKVGETVKEEKAKYDFINKAFEEEQKPSFSVATQTGTLVSAAQKLTGDKGREIVMPGVHKMAIGAGTQEITSRREADGTYTLLRKDDGTVVESGVSAADVNAKIDAARKVVGSPIFRDPSGNPETRITGTVFDTDKSTANYEANGGFTLSRPSYAKKKWNPSPDDIQTIADRKLNGTGHDLASAISAMEDADPADRAWAEYLIRNMPETLKRVTSTFDRDGQTVMTPFDRERKGEITFAPWTLKDSDVRAARVMLEELNHHVEYLALEDPKNVLARQGFEKLRSEVIAGLSKEERKAFDKQAKLLKDNPSRIIKEGEVHKDTKIEDLIYSLQNVHEFVANGNTAHPLRERLVSMERNKGWLSKFVDNIKALFGIGPKETAFDEFLYHTEQIMNSHEAVAKSMNYLEAHFEQLGYDSNRANDAAQVAMRLMDKHGIGKGDPQRLFAELAKPSDMDSNELSQARNKFKRLMASPDDKEMANTAMLFDDPNTGKAVENWFMEQLDTPSSVSYFKALPQSVQDYLSLRVQQMQDVLSGIHNLAKNGSAPVTDLLAPKPLQQTAKEMLERLSPFVRQQNAVRTAVSQIRALDSFGTENMLQVMGKALPAKKGRETPDGFVDEKIGWLRKLTLQIGQWAQSNPLVKELLVRMTGSDTLARKFAQSVQHDVLGYDPTNPGVYNEKIAEGWRKWLEEGQNKDMVDTIMRVNNVTGKDKVALLPWDHPAMKAAGVGAQAESGPYGGATVKELALLKAHQFVKQMAIGTQKGQAHILHRMGENGTVQGAKLVLLQEKELNVEGAMTASRNVLDALVALKENPADVLAGQKLEQAQAVLQPKTLEQLMEAQDKMSKVLIAAKLHFKNNPGWVTAQRKGEFLYKGFRGTEEILMGADNDKEVLTRARKHGVKIELDSKKPNDPGDYATMDWSQDFIDKAKAYDEHQQTAGRAAGLTDEQLSVITKLAPGAAILKDQHVSHDIGAAETKGRTLSKGGDIVPFTDHFFSWLKGSPAYWNKRLIREQVEMTLLAPEYRAAPETSKGLRQWLNGFLTPDPKPMQALQRAVTTFTLGGNVGFLMNNVFQPFLRGIPEIMSHEVGFWQAFRGVTGALKDAVKSFTKVGGMTDLSKGLSDSNERWFMERLNNDLITDRSLFDEVEMRKGYDSYKLTASLNASKPKTFGQWVASVGGAYSNVALSMVRHGERANTEATALGAFRALMRTFPEKGREWAESKARDIHQATNDPGGRFNRAIGLYDNAGPASRSAAMMAGALQSCTFGTINQIIRSFQKGWRNSSLTPAEKYAGRKAFLTQLGLQFAVAGALGMPFVSGALALINQVDPSLEINKNVRGLMQQFFAEDGKDGHPLTDMMMSGLPSQLGWDMQSRLSSGELIPGVSERDGFQVSNLFGVPASLATQMAGGVKQIMNGQGSGLMAFVPPGLRSQFRLATGTAGEDAKGRPVLNDMTAGEKVGLALGMRPTRLREFNDAQRMEKQAEEQDAIRKGQWRQEAAAKVLKGEFGTVIGELKGQLQANPKLDVTGEVRQIAKYAEDQAFPRDLRREAKGDARSALLQQWNLAPSQPTEEQRLQFRMKVEQQFGVKSEGGQALMNARMMDELRKQKPDATRAELRGMLPRAQKVQPQMVE